MNPFWKLKHVLLAQRCYYPGMPVDEALYIYSESLRLGNAEQ